MKSATPVNAFATPGKCPGNCTRKCYKNGLIRNRFFVNLEKGGIFVWENRNQSDWLTVTANPSEIYQPNSSRYYDEFYQRNGAKHRKSFDDIAARLNLGEYIKPVMHRWEWRYEYNRDLQRKVMGEERQYKKVAGYHPLYEYKGICIEFREAYKIIEILRKTSNW